MVQDEVIFYGHPNILSDHPKTLEITRASDLTLRGDCIIGVRANKACSDLNQVLKRHLKDDGSTVNMEIIANDGLFQIVGHANKRLLLLNKHDIVIRKSNFICPRTLAICCNKASSDIPRELVHSLRNSQMKGIFRITIE